MLRLLNMMVVAILVLAAAWVYEIKYASTQQAERVAKLRIEIRQERDAIAALRAEWAALTNPDRIQRLALRHLHLRPIEALQFDKLDGLPERPPEIVPPGTTDPIGAIIESTAEDGLRTGSVPPATEQQ